mmetsp:Transcript_78142/g.217002  ORF Transcript_78142/g.217002 Transcript_78142/m.217002 type:complete len:108 (-) Transcript_78142:99-422(-)|eukprot:CAMPEP_0117579690 /NCGR_PEP_ID=MMETSP0784-20121206/64762_1 /TAXON_ID=39447 /ORGANISM="" /LENGTH=107 /DNA_ID=CAMNT_0005379619 /DNA_START=30 /DNA_END=353 /DNA_ORIENTATION=-
MSSLVLGTTMLVVGTCVFVYFTAWVLLLPMWAPGDAPWLHCAFPPRRWALMVPGLALATAIAVLTAFVGLVLADALPAQYLGQEGGDAFEACQADGRPLVARRMRKG